MDQLIVREAINASWAFLCLAIASILLFRVAREARVPGFYQDLGNQIAIAVAVYFLGAAGYRFTIVVLLYYFGTDNGEFKNFYIYAFFFAGIALAGALCCIRLFSTGIGNWLWFSIFLITVGIGSTILTIGGYGGAG